MIANQVFHKWEKNIHFQQTEIVVRDNALYFAQIA